MMVISYLRKAKRVLLNRYRAVAYRGSDVQCLICGWEGKHFFENAKCPSCGSLPRTRLLALSIDTFKIDLADARILHVAPNYPEFSFIRKNIREGIYDRIDINSKIKYINLIGDVTNLPAQDECYDLVIMWHVMEHIPDDHRAIREIKRVLKEQGRLLLSVPIYPLFSPVTYEDPAISRAEYKKVHGHPDHCRSCGMDYYQRFEALGFSTRTIKNSDLDPEVLRRFGLSKGHLAWLFEKMQDAI